MKAAVNNVVIALGLFVVFKFAPRFFDKNIFWASSLKLLNKLRAQRNGVFYIAKVGNLYIRDPYCLPQESKWKSSKWHPFCLRRTQTQKA